jgi:hypothetical protein
VVGLGSLVVFWLRKLFDDKHAGLPIEINMSFSSTTLFLVYLRYRKIFTAANLLQGNLIPCGWSDITTEKTKSLTNEVINLVCSILMYDLMVQLKTSDIISIMKYYFLVAERKPFDKDQLSLYICCQGQAYKYNEHRGKLE